jgi:glycosyltransferase involved in cell wall biosynthesis
MQILVLSTWWPEPADNGSRMRSMQLLRALGVRHTVHLIAFSQGPAAQVQQHELRQICASVTAIERPGRPLTLRDRVQSLFVAEPASVRATWSDAFAAAVAQATARYAPDVAVGLEIDVAPYLRQIPGIPRLLEELELGYMLEQFQQASTPRQRLRSWLTVQQHRRYVRALLADLAAVTVVSAREAALVRNLVGKRSLPIAIIPNGADVAGAAAYSYNPDPDTLIYPGALSYAANLDAVRYFVQSIFPLIRAQRPQTILRITGRTTPAQQAAIGASDGVIFTGYVDDVRALIARSAVEVVPLRQGGGTRLKILEALALGTPVVSTPKGSEGLDLVDGTHLRIATSPQQFAAHTLELLQNATLRQQLGSAGRVAVQAQYDWHIIADRFCDLVSSVGMRNSYADHAA